MNQFLKWAAEMDRAASVAEAESDGSPQFLAIIDGNRAIAEALRQGAALEARLESTEHVSRRRGDDLNRIRAMCTPAAQEPDIESTPDCVRRNLVALRKEADATKAKLAEALEKRDGAFALVRSADSERIIAEGQLAALSEIHPFHQWHDDDGAVLWFCLPVSEPPFHVGTLDDSDWPWGANDMADAKFTAQIGWSRMPRVNQNIIAARGAGEGADDDGCPKSDPGCMSRSDECHDACETPKGPACGHSACSQHFIDTGSVACVEGETDGS